MLHQHQPRQRQQQQQQQQPQQQPQQEAEPLESMAADARSAGFLVRDDFVQRAKDSVAALLAAYPSARDYYYN
jgi:hypothetical protein